MGCKESDITEQLTHTLRDNKGALKHCIQKVPTRVRMNRRYTCDEFKEIVQKIINTREYAKEKLASLGFEFTDSKTNFLFATHKSISAEKIFNELKKKNIYVRYFNKPRIDNYLRITIGNDEEMDALYKALEEIINQ